MVSFSNCLITWYPRHGSIYMKLFFNFLLIEIIYHSWVVSTWCVVASCQIVNYWIILFIKWSIPKSSSIEKWSCWGITHSYSCIRIYPYNILRLKNRFTWSASWLPLMQEGFVKSESLYWQFLIKLSI